MLLVRGLGWLTDDRELFLLHRCHGVMNRLLGTALPPLLGINTPADRPVYLRLAWYSGGPVRSSGLWFPFDPALSDRHLGSPQEHL